MRRRSTFAVLAKAIGGNSARFPLVLLAVLAGLRLWFGYGAARASTFEFNDISQWVDAGDRILAGDVPYRDFFGLYGPLLYYWSAFWYRLFGAGLFGAGLHLEVISPVACLAIAWLVGRLVFEKTGPQMIFLACVGFLGFDRFFWTPAIRIWLPLLGLAIAEKGLRGQDKISYAAGCLLCGTCVFVSAEAGLASILACGAAAAGWFFVRKRPAGGWLATWMLVFAPAALAALIFPDVVAGYLRNVRGLALVTNWYAGQPFPEFAWSIKGAAYYGPFGFVGLLACALPFSIALVGGKGRKMESAGELALAVFCAVLLRSVLGRSDDFHLAFAAVPIILLVTRLFFLSGFVPASYGFPLFLVFLYPFLYIANPAWESRRPIWVANPAAFERDFPWVEGVQLRLSRPTDLVRIAAKAREMAPEGVRLLSLPIPIYAHMAGRLSVLPFSFPEHILVLKDGPKRLVEALEREKVPLVVYDPSFCYPFDETKDLMTVDDDDFFRRRFTWPATADEVLTRELRAYLRANYRIALRYAGGYFLLRRAKALPPPREELAGLLSFSGEELSALAAGEKIERGLPAGGFDEIRVDLALKYWPGMEAFAKTALRVVLFDSSGGRRMGELPVPTEYVGRDLRIPAGNRPLKGILLRLVNKGAFNPEPRAVSRMKIELVRIVHPSEDAGF